MKTYEIILGDETARFYELVARTAGLKTERVLADSLFRLAGELSLKAAAQRRDED